MRGQPKRDGIMIAQGVSIGNRGYETLFRAKWSSRFPIPGLYDIVPSGPASRTVIQNSRYLCSYFRSLLRYKSRFLGEVQQYSTPYRFIHHPRQVSPETSAATRRSAFARAIASGAAPGVMSARRSTCRILPAIAVAGASLRKEFEA